VTSESPTIPLSFPIIPSVVITSPSSVIKMTTRKDMLSDKMASKAVTAPKAMVFKAIVSMVTTSKAIASSTVTAFKAMTVSKAIVDQDYTKSILIGKSKYLTEVEVKDGKGKGKNKGRKSEEFYQDVIKKLAHELFHEHQQVNDIQMKMHLKDKLENNEDSAEQLQMLRYRDISIKPYGNGFSKEQMRIWKGSESIRKVHENLYMPSNPDDLSSNTYITLIIKSIFTSEKERTQKNAIWTQSVLKVIFDENYLSTKIDSDIIESWTENLIDAEAGLENNDYSPNSEALTH
ncbi:2551_t:CDS:2, partial [Funneliformis caledonium]